MKTPLCDFIAEYVKKDAVRLHMPGHKGKSVLGAENMDITEVKGADVLYHETGILMESQKNATEIFGSQKTLYSTEGSTLAIRAMLALAVKYAKEMGRAPIIAAARNAHKAFLTSCALLDLDPIWLEVDGDLYSSPLTAKSLRDFLDNTPTLPIAVYITSPDYLGNIMDVEALSQVCREKDVLLLVDNAHGAYLNFLPESHHPLAKGASMCCDSAHKTLPVLTGGAYLHIGKDAPRHLSDWAESTMALFSSTSPSYLILASLDACNAYLNRSFREELVTLAASLWEKKKRLRKKGYLLAGNEPLKMTLMPKSYGYTGDALAQILRERGFECEFSDPDHLCLMFTPVIREEHVERLIVILEELPQKEPILEFPPKIKKREKRLSPRKALLSPSVSIPVLQAEGRILAEPGITCPPAIPIAICGEVIDKSAMDAFSYYGISQIQVVKEG